MSARAARRGSNGPEMVTLTDPDGQDFETGDLATVNSLLCAGYKLKGSKTYSDVAEALAPPPAVADGK